MTPGNFTKQNDCQNSIRQSVQAEPIKFRGVHGGITKSGLPSPKGWQPRDVSHSHAPIALLFNGLGHIWALHLKYISVFFPISYIPTGSLHPSQAFLAGPWLFSVWTWILWGHCSHPSQITSASSHTQQNWLIFVCNVNIWLPYFVDWKIFFCWPWTLNSCVS